MATVARAVPAGPVAVAARSYQPGAADEGPADRAVAGLVRAFGGVAGEATAARIALLLQACEATAGLVGNAILAVPHCPVETIISETLQRNPPVRFTRRLGQDGSPVVLDLAASGLPFGAGAHECPGRRQATALATGFVESFRDFRLAEPEVEWLPPAALRIPARLIVTRCRAPVI
jgi:hypothetical protein